MRRCFNENARLVMEQLLGAAKPAQAQQPVKPVPGKATPAQQVAAGVQATANQAATQAAAAGDQQIQQQMAAQQGQTPQQQAAAAKTIKAQPQPTRVNPTAVARDQRNDNLVNRQQAQSGKVVQADESFDALDKLLVEDEVSAAKQEGEDASNADEKEGFNDNPAKARAKERAAEVLPGAKDNKAAGWGKDGAGRPQGHHEVTHPGQRIQRSTEKGKADESVQEQATVYTDAERAAMLDKVFGG